MRIMTAHKILIATAAAFFLFYAGWEMVRSLRTGDMWGMPRGLVALAVGIGLGLYFRYLARKRSVADLAAGLSRQRRPM